MSKDERTPLRAISITFAYPVELTLDEEKAIHDIVAAAAKRSSTDEVVHWLAGYGSAHNMHFDQFDDSVLVMECSARDRYPSERLAPVQEEVSA